MNELDELFGGEDAPTPQTGLIGGLLIGGWVLTFLGLACTVLPGGLLILLSYHYADRETERVNSGYLGEEHRPAVRLLQILTRIGVVLVLVVSVIQAKLTLDGTYELFWGSLFTALRLGLAR